MSNYTLTKSYHSKKGIDIWLVKLTNRTDYSQFKQIERLVKTAGGYYSNFVKAFVFEKEPTEEILNEIFGGAVSISETAKQAGVDEKKVARIRLSGKGETVRRDVLRNEINDGKLLAARSEYFDGMTDSTRYIKEEDMVWEDASMNAGLMETLRRDYHKPYAYNGMIRLGDYKLKYKEGIVQPEAPKEIRQRQTNFYVIMDEPDTREGKFELERVDSNSLDLEIGTRVVSSMYGRKACGTITDKKISTFTISSWSPFGGGEKKAEEKQSASYKVKYDNGVISSYATFMVTDDCGITMPKGILYDDDYVFPEQFYSKNIVGEVKMINSLRQQKASRKKAEYAEQDQRSIDRHIETFKKNAGKWLAWEKDYPLNAYEISGESIDEAENRRSKWIEEFGITEQPYSLDAGAKTYAETQAEQKKNRAEFAEKVKDHVAAKAYKFPTKMLHDIYLTLLMRRFYDNYTVEQLPERLHLMATNLAGKGNEKARQAQINAVTGQLVAPSNARVIDVENVWKQWLTQNTDVFNPDTVLEQVKQPEPVVEAVAEVVSVQESPEDKIKNLEKRIKGLEISLKLNPSDQVEKRLKGLKISLNLLKK